MSITKSKREILEDNGFKYHFTRMIYFNKSSKKIFSFEAIEDHDEAWINNCIGKKNQDWEFYFTIPENPPPERIKTEIIAELTK